MFKVLLLIYWLGFCLSLAFLTHSKTIGKYDRQRDPTITADIGMWTAKILFSIFWWIALPLSIVNAFRRGK